MFSKPVPKLPEPTLPRSVVQRELPDTERVNRQSVECRAFQKCFSVLADGISNPGWLAIQLYSKELIGPELREEAHKSAIEEQVKIVKLLSAVENQIVTNPATKFREFLDILQSEPSLQHLASRLENAHNKLCTPSVTPTSSRHVQHPQSSSVDANSLPLTQEPRTGIVFTVTMYLSMLSPASYPSKGQIIGIIWVFD